jgi:hypothetical protein
MAAATFDLFLAVQRRAYRRICAWCSMDLGALTYDSEQHSFGICTTCAHQYFADLYAAEEHETTAPMLRERAVGAD